MHEARIKEGQRVEPGVESAPTLQSLQGGGSDAGSPAPVGEGPQAEADSKYWTIDAFSLKHVSYLENVKHKIEQAFFVPRFAPDQGPVGMPMVGFTVCRNGALAEVVLLRSSGYLVLDQALVKTVERAAPYAPFPDYLTGPSISIRVYATVK